MIAKDETRGGFYAACAVEGWASATYDTRAEAEADQAAHDRLYPTHTTKVEDKS